MASLIRPVNVQVNNRKSMALQLRTAGLNYREILSEMVARYGSSLPSSYDERYVYRDVKSEFDRLRAQTLDNAQDLRLLELERLDQLQAAVLPKALSGDLKAVDRMLKIIRLRAELVGAFAPTTTKVEVSDWRSEVISLIKDGTITIEQAEEELGKDIVAGLLNAGGVSVIEGQYSTEQIQGEADIP